MKKFLWAMVVIGLGIFSAAQAPAGSVPAKAKSPAAPSSAASTADWQKKWDDTVAAAKKEGELFIYLNAPSEARTIIPEAFKRKYGITLNVISGSGIELASRLVTEYRSGIHQVDAYMAGGTTALVAKAQGVLAPVTPLLILPEVTSPKAWFGQNIPFFDKDGTVFTYLSQVIPPVIYNTGLVKEGQITSYHDLLKPEWKGKMVMYDPTVGGAASFWFTGLTQELGSDKANEYLTALAKQQEVMVTRDMGQQMEWVTRGKYPLALFPQTPAVSQYLQAGAPVAAAAFRELTLVANSNGGFAVPKFPPHPNAATVFLNWFLSKEGQTLAVKGMGAPSTRIDIPPDNVNPMFVIKPGQKYILQSEELTQDTRKWTEGWKKIFAR